MTGKGFRGRRRKKRKEKEKERGEGGMSLFAWLERRSLGSLWLLPQPERERDR